MTSTLTSANTEPGSDVTLIEPRSGWNYLNLNELWVYRELLFVMMMRDIKVRYKQTILGVAWAIIQPLTMMVIFTLIFGRLAKIPSDGYPYPVFVFSGLLAWNFFATSVGSAGGSLVGSNNLVSKIYFPRLIIPLSSIGVAMVDFLVACVILLLMMLAYGMSLSMNLFFLPLFVVGLIMVSAGMGGWLAAVTVSYRDFRFVIPFMLQIWMYITPVIYPLSFIPEKWQWVMYLNPMYIWIMGIRGAFLNQSLDYQGILISLILSFLIFLIGIAYFGRTERRFADVI